MAHEDFVRFLELVNGDDGLRNQIASIETDSEREAVRRLVEVGAEHGCSFDETDIDALFLASAVHEARGDGAELSLEALDTVAGGTDALLSATRSMQEMNMSFNLQYLSLQNSMQSENRQFTMVSNIMKTKHDTAKAAINNIR